jgi:hypothetical protein
MRRTLMVAALLAVGTTAGAQGASRTFEARAFFGGVLAAGAMRDEVQDAVLVGLQGALQVAPRLHVVGTVGAMPTRAIVDGTDDHVSVVQYDLGLELGLARRERHGTVLRPYAALGVGARTYWYDAAALEDRTGVVGVGALGLEWKAGTLAVRTEGRASAFRYRSPVRSAGGSMTGSDVGLVFALARHFR